MQRITDPTAVGSLPPPPVLTGTTGYFGEGNPGITEATDLRSWWLSMVQEELMSILTAAGVTPDTGATQFNQVLQSVRRLTAANVTSVSSSPGAPLTVDEAGLILVDATAGSIAMTLPAVAAANGTPLRYTFARLDNTANSVSVAVHSGDTVALGSAPISIGPLSRLGVVGDGVSRWVQDLSSSAQTVAWMSHLWADAGTANAMVVTLSPTPTSMTALQNVPFTVSKSSASNTSGITLNVNGLGATSVLYADGSAFTSGQWPAYADAVVEFNGSSFIVLSNPAPSLLATKAFVTAAIAAVPSPFSAQYDVTASRSANVTYTNTTGGPMGVAITVSSSTSSSYANLVVGGITVSTWADSVNSVGFSGSVGYIVPNGVTYGLSGGPAITKWVETHS
jgi:hypothetical protein